MFIKLAETRTGINSIMSSISSHIGLFASELLTLDIEHFSHRLLMEKNVVDAIAPSFLIGSFSVLLVTRKGIKSWTSLILGQVGQISLELLALE